MMDKRRQRRRGTGAATAALVVAGVVLILPLGIGLVPILGLTAETRVGNYDLITRPVDATAISPRIVPYGFRKWEGKLSLRLVDRSYFWHAFPADPGK